MIAFFALFVVASGVSAARWQAQSWTTDDTLPQGTVHGIWQTRDGYLWFTTYGGLVRYDGIEFRVFERATTRGIASNRFTTIFEDSSGTLWAGTEDGFITANRKGVFRSYHAGGPGNAICTIGEYAGTIWVLSNDGFFAFDGTTFIPRLPPALHEAGFTTPYGYGYHQGFAYASPQGVEVIGPGKRVTVKTEDRVARVYADQHGALWITQRAGLLRFLNGQTRSFPLGPETPPGGVSAVLLASDGAPWVAIEGRGVARIGKDGIDWVTPSDGLASPLVTTLFEDREGEIWAGSADNGITCIRPRIATVFGVDSGLPNPNVYPLIVSGTSLLAGTWGSGLYRLVGDRFQPVGTETGHIMSVLEEPDGTLWWTTYGQGITRFKNGQRREFTTADGLPNLIVPVLYRDRKGRIWAGTYGGLVRFDGDRFRPLPINGAAPWHEIHVLAEDRDGSLLVGTRAGLGRLRSGKLEIVADERSGLVSGNVRAIHVDGDGTLWVGTYDGGVSRIRNGHVATITTREGLFDNGVFSILEDNAFFWMSCNRGIYRVARTELDAVADGNLRSLSALSLTRRDGLESAECNGGVQSAGCRTADGRLWFPTQRGVVMIEPRLLHSGGPPPDVQIVSASVDGDEVPVAAPLRVSAGGKRIDIHYASMTFIDSERIRYRTMLEGLDGRWSQIIGRRTVSYTGLAAGRYRFVVSAANAAGQWNSHPASIDIVVLPPFWRTAWFLTLVAGLIAAALGVVFWLRLRTLEKRRAAQAEFSRRLILQQEEERKRVAVELHDSLGQNLLVIKNRALLAAERESDTAAVAQQLCEISETASTAIDEVRRIAYNLRPAELDQLGVTRAIEALLRRIGAASPILLSSRIDPIDGLLSKEAEVNIFRIIQEWMSNVVRHSGATAAVVSITREPPRLLIRVHDDGAGLGQQATGQRIGLGIRGISERARILGGTCEITSREGEGTTMTVHVDTSRVQ